MKIVSMVGVNFHDGSAHINVTYEDESNRIVDGKTLQDCMRQLLQESEK